MTLPIFQKILSVKTDKSASHILLCGIKEVTMLFCYLSKIEGHAVPSAVVNLFGVPVTEKEMTGVKVCSGQNIPYAPNECLAVLILSGKERVDAEKAFAEAGCKAVLPLDNGDLNDLFKAAGQNFYFENKLQEYGARAKSIAIYGYTPNSFAVYQTLKMSGWAVEAIVDEKQNLPTDMFYDDTPLVASVENPEDFLLIAPMDNDETSIPADISAIYGSVLPVYSADMLAIKYYFQNAQKFHEYFDMSSPKVYCVQYEKQAKQIMSRFDKVNICRLDTKNITSMLKAFIIALRNADKRRLIVFAPTDQHSVSPFLFEKMKRFLTVIEPKDKMFWRYFLENYAFSVKYLLDIDDEIICPEADAANKFPDITNDMGKGNTKSEYGDYVVFGGDSEKNSEVLREALGKLNLEHKVVQNFDESDFISINRAAFVISDNSPLALAAIILQKPLIMINALSLTYEGLNDIYSTTAPFIILPQKRIYKENLCISLFWQLDLEERVGDVEVRSLIYKQNGVETVNNDSNEIAEAVQEMKLRLSGDFFADKDDDYRQKRCKKLLINSLFKKPRQTYRAFVGQKFLLKNLAYVGMIYNIRNLFTIDSFLPKEKLDNLRSRGGQKIKIRLLDGGSHAYNEGVRTFLEACDVDSDIDLLVITCAKDPNNPRDVSLQNTKANFEERGIKNISETDYDIASDKPDIFVLFNLCRTNCMPKVREYSKLVVVLAFPVISYSPEGNIEIFMKYFYNWTPYNPDYYLFDSLLYNQLRDHPFFQDKNIVEMGNCKYDGIYECCKKKEFPPAWEKLRGRKIILWATDHGIYEECGLTDEISFDVYAKTIFDYMDKNPDMALILRFHPTFMSELTAKFNLWTEEDIHVFREYVNDCPNIVFDESKSYNMAYSVSDAIIADPHCGVLASALPTMRPICVAYRSHYVRDYELELVQSYYRVYSPDEMLDFFDMIKRGEDTKYEERKRVAEKNVLHFDGKNGQRAKEFMKKIIRIKNEGKS